MKHDLQRHAKAPHAIYRCYDASGHLLYVGCSMNPAGRAMSHQSVIGNQVAS